MSNKKAIIVIWLLVMGAANLILGLGWIISEDVSIFSIVIGIVCLISGVVTFTVMPND